MSLWAIVPVKPFRLGKSRLASVLSEVERYKLNRCLFENTLANLRAVKGIERTLVISRDPQALSIARAQEALTVQEGTPSSLNSAIVRATHVTQLYKIQSLLILPADLPLVNLEDLQSIASLADRSPLVAIVPDRHRKGTNALLVNPTGLIGYSFGENSFELHCQAARQVNAQVEIPDLPRLALDLDMPEDLEYLKKGIYPQSIC